MREDPQYQTFDHLMKEFHAQQEVESAVRVSIQGSTVSRDTPLIKISFPSVHDSCPWQCGLRS